MNMPQFTAGLSLYGRDGYYHCEQSSGSHANTVIPAIPFCGNCDYILNRCAQNDFRPRALCWACLTGHCFSGVENPPPVLQNPPPHF